MRRDSPPLLLREHLLFFFIAAPQLLDALVVVVDCGGEGAFRALLADDELVEVLLEDGGGDAGWGVGVAEGTLGGGGSVSDEYVVRVGVGGEMVVLVLQSAGMWRARMGDVLTSVGPPGS